MDRRGFLKWLGGGIGATVALTSSQVSSARELWETVGTIDPASMLWMPDEPKLVLPEQDLVIVERKAKVAVYRLTPTTHSRLPGSYWFDEDFNFVEAFDPKGQPMALFNEDGEAPSVNRLRKAIEGGYWRRRDMMETSEGMVARWPALLTQPEKDIVADILLKKRPRRR